MRIPIVPIKQTTPKNCWLACLQMVMNYYQYSVTLEEIDNFITKDKYGGSFLTEQARFVKSKGFTADCFAYNLFYTHPSYSELSKEDLIYKIKDRKRVLNENWHSQIESTIQCIESGVNYFIKNPRP